MPHGYIGRQISPDIRKLSVKGIYAFRYNSIFSISRSPRQFLIPPRFFGRALFVSTPFEISDRMYSSRSGRSISRQFTMRNRVYIYGPKEIRPWAFTLKTPLLTIRICTKDGLCAGIIFRSDLMRESHFTRPGAFRSPIPSFGENERINYIKQNAENITQPASQTHLVGPLISSPLDT